MSKARSVVSSHFRDWLALEEDDLTWRLRHYSRFRYLLVLFAVGGFIFSFRALWRHLYSWPIELLDQLSTANLTLYQARIDQSFWQAITVLGDLPFTLGLYLILALVLVLVNKKRAATVSVVVLGISLVCLIGLKVYFARPRPFLCPFSHDCFSFPSGHATLSFYAYGLLDYLIFRFLPVGKRTYLFITLLLSAIIVLVCLSRLFLFVHYPSDIIGGFLLGSSWLLIAVLLVDILY